MKDLGTSKEFIKGQETEWETVGEGVKRQIMGYDDKILLAKVHFKEGGVGPMHEHHHSQVTYVVSGKFELTVGDETRMMEGGDSFYIPPHKMHGAICREEGVLIDVFSPIREDFF